VKDWSPGKKAEFYDRKTTSVKDAKSQLIREQTKTDAA
jgi:hypothetical protein